MSTPKNFVAVAGAAGHLGSLIALELRKRSVSVKALVRPGTATSRTQELEDAGVTIVPVEMSDVPALTTILTGATTVVSALQGLRPVILGVQGALLEAAVAAKVNRFIPSDFSLDFTKTTPGSNRNCDLRREFHAKLNESGIAWTSIMNGGFMKMFLNDLPLINHKWHRIIYIGSPDQQLDITMVPDVAAFTAAVAADPKPTPQILRIAGDTFDSNSLAALVTKMRGETYTPMWTGSVGFLRVMISILKAVIGGVEDKVFPPWQGMQYMENMYSGEGKLDPLDNGRYPELKWTNIEMALKDIDAKKDKKQV